MMQFFQLSSSIIMRYKVWRNYLIYFSSFSVYYATDSDFESYTMFQDSEETNKTFLSLGIDTILSLK